MRLTVNLRPGHCQRPGRPVPDRRPGPLRGGPQGGSGRSWPGKAARWHGRGRTA